MPTEHPADARQTARAALAALPPAARPFLDALHAEHFPPRADGGMVYRLEDLHCHLAGGARGRPAGLRMTSSAKFPAALGTV